MNVNAPIMMAKAKLLAGHLRITPKEAYELLDVRISIMCDKPMIDIEKLDAFLSLEEGESTLDGIIRKYSKEACDFILTLI